MADQGPTGSAGGSGGGGGGIGNILGKIFAGGVGAAGGAFPAPGTKTTTTQGEDFNQSFNQNTANLQTLESFLNTLTRLKNEQTGTSTTTPGALGGPQQALLDQLTQRYSNLGDVNLQPYEANQINQINRNASLQSKAADNIMAARGLGTSPVAGTTAANIDANRINQISGFQSTLPLLQRQLEQQNLAGASSFLQSIPRGISTTQTGTSLQTGETNQKRNDFTEGTTNTGNITQGARSGGSTSETKPVGGGGIGGILQSLAPMLLSMFV